MDSVRNLYDPELTQLCEKIKSFIEEKNFDLCAATIESAMCDYPHAPHPHNLMGILMEIKGDHVTAMKHFRAAWALDPTYLPPRINMERYGSFFRHEPCVYDA